MNYLPASSPAFGGKNFPKVFIVILNYNGKEVIKKCLASVFKINYPNFEVVLVDNNSTDGSFEVAKINFSKASFIKNEENLGFSSGINIGIKFSLERMAEYVFILNNDTEVDTEFLGHLVKVFRKDEKIGITSPVIFETQTKEVWFSGGSIKWSRMKNKHSQSIKVQDYYESGFISGCAMLIKKEVFKKIGLFDEDFFLYWEDADFSLRAKKEGFKNVVVSDSWVYHSEQSRKQNKRKIYWLVISGLVFFKKNTPFRWRLWIKFWLFLRKTKNKVDLLFGDKYNAEIIKRAFDDFKKAGF
ncbi:MAG: hypothetical protein COU40_03480 [Candidatus Moranbacteria bacterium CG10_big_fil_rev_8_21_14_0_10_35_21]|nr:MAG: hypothetical protein COU40_03480 [Candidatus Moranbacteria bacterium CG10_big_fil_rev_8_21_14_0_10_35_21]PJA88758.1 MAG: hypothetical protein CO139_01420 [Candidatus Moranbacteria bacterium CG_4_9_14_3_um_filter_36_9]